MGKNLNPERNILLTLIQSFNQTFLPYDFDRTMFKNKKFWGKVVLLWFLSLVIGYMIAPKILFDSAKYHEGDIIRQTVVIEEDLLLPDHISTRLKAEKMLNQQGMIFDYDPNVAEKISTRIREAFSSARQMTVQIESQGSNFANTSRQVAVDYFEAHQNLALATQERNFYRRYSATLQERLKGYNGDEQRTPKEFLKKSKLDNDIDTMGHAVKDLGKKRALYLNSAEKQRQSLLLKRKEGKSFSKELKEKQELFANDFLDKLKIDLALKVITKLNFPFYDAEIEEELTAVTKVFLSQEIIFSKKDLKLEEKLNLTVRNVTTQESKKYKELEDLTDVEEIVLQLRDFTNVLFPNDESGQKRNLIHQLSEKLIGPTVTLNKLEMEKRKEQARSGISPVYFSVKKGEIIARAGDRATPDQVELINAYYEKVSNLDKIPRFIGLVCFVLVSFILVYFAFRRSENSNLNFKKITMIGLSILIGMLFVTGGTELSKMIEMRYSGFGGQLFIYAFPIALPAMLIGILLGFEAGLMTGLLTSLFVSIMMQSSLYYFFFGIMGSLVAALPIRSFFSRYSLLAHGIKISFVNIPLVSILYLIEANQLGGVILHHLGSALAGGVLTAILVSILLPFFESTFDVTTNLKLLELSNLHHPALADLIQKANGTFQHSVVVGNLAEAGAKEIGANPLLARVGAYYHDLGKGEDPIFFYENKPANMQNIHDSMTPYESVQKIVGHVTKGEAIAKHHHIGSAVTDILMQHHGTTAVKYFLIKAKKMALESGSGPVNEADFCYPGPKPQTLEAGLVMLADGCEAATRSIDKPTIEAIEEMVKKVTWGILESGQLDESGMTLRKFKQVVAAFNQSLCTIYHSRISYPDDVVGYTDSKQSLYI
ncbi:MAG: HDIG domain-containing protein [SAR324 cluster bacterium]|nr:HDIG domain-containing protein [SAR324 cluster bacterium]